jgi:hypothetical protein
MNSVNGLTLDFYAESEVKDRLSAVILILETNII